MQKNTLKSKEPVDPKTLLEAIASDKGFSIQRVSEAVRGEGKYENLGHSLRKECQTLADFNKCLETLGAELIVKFKGKLYKIKFNKPQNNLQNGDKKNTLEKE